MTDNQFGPKSQTNFLELGSFAMGQSSNLKHRYFFLDRKTKSIDSK